MINHHFKKGKLGSMMAHLFLWVTSFDASFNNIMPYIIDVGLRSMAIIILGEERAEHSPFIKELNSSHMHVGHILAMAPHSVLTPTENVSLTHTSYQ